MKLSICQNDQISEEKQRLDVERNDVDGVMYCKGRFEANTRYTYLTSIRRPKHCLGCSRAHLAWESGLNYDKSQREILSAWAETIGKESPEGMFQVSTIPSQTTCKTTSGKCTARSYRR